MCLGLGGGINTGVIAYEMEHEFNDVILYHRVSSDPVVESFELQFIIFPCASLLH